MSSIWNRVFRRRPQRQGSAHQYQQEEAYILGTGHGEVNRLDLQHFMFRWEFQGDFSVPLRDPLAILDVACGTGRWAREMARLFPNANVIGFDNNAQQIEYANQEAVRRGDVLPDNCTLLVGDALQPFPYGDGIFQMTMARANSAYVPIEYWPRFLAEMVRVTAHGGWMEVRDFGVVQSQSQALTTMVATFSQLATARGIYPGLGPYITGYFDALPLREKHMRRVTARYGQRPSRGGRLLITDFLALLERVAPGIDRAGLMEQAQWQRLLQQARSEVEGGNTEVELVAAYGRR